MATIQRTVRCQQCGHSLRIRITAQHSTIDRSTVGVRVTAAAEDQAWCQLFTAAHRGPFTARSTR